MKDTKRYPPAPVPRNEFRTTLVGLLESDDELKQTIRQIAAPSPAALALDTVSESRTSPVFAEQELLDWINADAELKDAWLSVEESEERQLVRLIATAAQWDRLLQLWDHLATRCKNEKRSASATEFNILSRCLDIHNLIWQERQASLQTAGTGKTFDPLLHERGQLHGDTVIALWLPGLHNAAGHLQRKPLVCT